MVTLLVWTEGYRPFIMGGNIHAPLGFVVEIPEKDITTCRGIRVAPIELAPGRVAVVELSTGAFVGTSLETVLADIKAAPEAAMKKQLEEAEARILRVQTLPLDDFLCLWKG